MHVYTQKGGNEGEVNERSDKVALFFVVWACFSSSVCVCELDVFLPPTRLVTGYNTVVAETQWDKDWGPSIEKRIN